jgi:hypothetical protein
MLLKKFGNGNNNDIICTHNHNIDHQHKEMCVYIRHLLQKTTKLYTCILNICYSQKITIEFNLNLNWFRTIRE